MDLELTGHDKRIYEVWLRSPSVFADDPAQTILAYKIGKETGLPGSRVLKVLRGDAGVDAAWVATVEEFVARDPDLHFEGEGPGRRLRCRG